MPKPISEPVTDNDTKNNKYKALSFGNQLLGYYLKNEKDKGPAWLKTTDVQFLFIKNGNPLCVIETLQPLSRDTGNSPFWFWQGRYEYESINGSVANFGIGWRSLSKNKTSLIGFNTFYDYGFQYKLARIGIGFEYFNKLTEYRINWYQPVSDDRQTNVSNLTNGVLYSYVRATEGLDCETGVSLPHIPWLKAYIGGYYWDNKHHDDEIGYKLRSTLQLSPRINIELGYLSSNQNNSFYGKVKYQLADNFLPASFARNQRSKGAELNDIRDRLWQKIERENHIKTETYTKFVMYNGNIRVAVTNSNNSFPLVGAIVQAYQNGILRGSAVATDSSGTAIITGLSAGTYTLNVTYGTYNETSSPVTVAKAQTTAVSVKLAVEGGSATVRVLNQHLQPISGASVTATMNNMAVASAESSWIDRVLGTKTAHAANSSFKITTTSDSSGVATFNNLLPGTYTFIVNSGSLKMCSQDFDITAGSTGAITILIPTSGGNIYITVEDAGGKMLGGVSVKAMLGNTIVASGLTDENGAVLLGGVADGEYTIYASLPNYYSNASIVTVVNGKTTKGTVTLTPENGTAKIKVSDGTNPLSGATVFTSVGGTVYTGTTDDTGVATISSLPVGDYIFTASMTGYTNGTCLVTINAGSTTNGYIELAGAGGAMTIMVTDGNNGIGGAQVSVIINGTIRTVAANESGKAIFRNLPTGTYKFSAGAPGYQVNKAYILVMSVDNRSSITLTGAGVLFINVMTYGGTRIGGASVSVKMPNGTEYSAISNNYNGIAYFWHIPNGIYTFTASKTGYETISQTITVNGETNAYMFF